MEKFIVNSQIKNNSIRICKVDMCDAHIQRLCNYGNSNKRFRDLTNRFRTVYQTSDNTFVVTWWFKRDYWYCEYDLRSDVSKDVFQKLMYFFHHGTDCMTTDYKLFDCLAVAYDYFKTRFYRGETFNKYSKKSNNGHKHKH